ncbi:YopX family protein [Streptococcus agalactiae]|uniref:YopX family protein n=1 Tax=Streptococcus agalactiae TaxID=1311 RepID=UPI0002BAAE75|nr:YopX family protein [Streptococcus agalactiae]EPT57600.1 hypothetical protein SAG0053_10105 [Streptococcus agalactiae CCUG 25532]EPW99990.1 hypothetical protein SAG0147_06045 [Streptococcus agalactiae MRI Z1-048]KAA9075268.1 hypothetical protein F5J11_01840 [Streptococcus agalactiae]KAF1122751.1 hypothetical protein B8V01_01695 [Streptococcus agalactiae]MCC4733920.1 YopX family protein [Streptococcus agalactiae]
MIPKFRAWLDPDMYEEPVIHNGKFYLDWRDFENGNTYDLAVLMQSTGMFDENGVEVFDGDIMFYEQDCYQYTLVKYDKDKLAFVLYDGCERLYHELWEPGEVIGNIYENPELLESVEE